MHEQRDPQLTRRPQRRRELPAIERREVGQPRIRQEALEAQHAVPAQPASPARLAGTAPPQKPTSTWHWPAAARRLAVSAAVLTVTGRLSSGMSPSVVMPPAAAALVAEAKPSHPVFPGSQTCTWVSTRPGSSTTSSSSVTVVVPSGRSRGGAIAAMRPAVTPMPQLASAAPTIARGARITRSKFPPNAPPAPHMPTKAQHIGGVPGRGGGGRPAPGVHRNWG